MQFLTYIWDGKHGLKSHCRGSVDEARSALNTTFDLLAMFDSDQLKKRWTPFNGITNKPAIRMLNSSFGVDVLDDGVPRKPPDLDGGAVFACTAMQVKRELVLLKRTRAGGPISSLADATGRQIRDACGTPSIFKGVVAGVWRMRELPRTEFARVYFADGDTADYTLAELQRVLVTRPFKPNEQVLVPHSCAGQWLRANDAKGKVSRCQWFPLLCAAAVFALRCALALRSGDLGASQSARSGHKRKHGVSAASPAVATPLAVEDVKFDDAGVEICLDAPKEAWLRGGGVGLHRRSHLLRVQRITSDFGPCAVDTLHLLLSVIARWKTKANSRGTHSVFVMLRKPHNPFSSDRISTLIKALLVRAGTGDGSNASFAPKNVRGFVATLWLQAGYTVETICHRCRWRDASTLRDHYLKTRVPCEPPRAFVRKGSFLENVFAEASDRELWRVPLVIDGNPGQVVAYVEPASRSQERKFKFVSKGRVSVETREVMQKALAAARCVTAASRGEGPVLAAASQ